MSDKIISTKSETMSIIWKEELKELGSPAEGRHINILFERCDALLRRLNEQEQIIIRLMGKYN